MGGNPLKWCRRQATPTEVRRLHRRGASGALTRSEKPRPEGPEHHPKHTKNTAAISVRHREQQPTAPSPRSNERCSSCDTLDNRNRSLVLLSTFLATRGSKLSRAAPVPIIAVMFCCGVSWSSEFCYEPPHKSEFRTLARQVHRSARSYFCALRRAFCIPCLNAILLHSVGRSAILVLIPVLCSLTNQLPSDTGGALFNQGAAPCRRTR
jgi:hypothetical protein